MIIHYTRHARRRMRLYQIDREELTRRLQDIDLKILPLGENEGIRSKIGTSIRVILVKREDRIVVRTNFPLKKGKKR
jgi:hypothetical protein